MTEMVHDDRWGVCSVTRREQSGWWAATFQDYLNFSRRSKIKGFLLFNNLKKVFKETENVVNNKIFDLSILHRLMESLKRYIRMTF